MSLDDLIGNEYCYLGFYISPERDQKCLALAAIFQHTVVTHPDFVDFFGAFTLTGEKYRYYDQLVGYTDLEHFDTDAFVKYFIGSDRAYRIEFVSHLELWYDPMEVLSPSGRVG